MSRIASLVLASLLVVACGKDNPPKPSLPPEQPKKVNHVVVLSGQSNMVGVNTLEYRDPNPRILSLNLDDQIVVAADPLYDGLQGSDDLPASTGSGPGVAFADTYITYLDQDDTITLVPCARGGSSIFEQLERDQTSGFGVTYSNSLLEVCVSRAKKAMQQPDSKFAGTLYWQGETDALIGTDFDVWWKGLETIKSTYEREFGPKSKFVFAQLADNYWMNEQQQQEQWSSFKSKQYEYSISRQIPMVQTDDVCDIIDGIHCSYQGAYSIGKRYVQPFIE